MGESKCYDTAKLALYILSEDMSTQAIYVFLSRLHQLDNDFLAERYRKSKYRLFSDVLYALYCLLDKESVENEISAVVKDCQINGSDITEKDLMPDFSDLDLYFMTMRIRIRLFNTKPYERMKLRTLLKDHGYKRRSKELVSYLNSCMDFYQIQPMLKGGQPCTLDEISLDDMITCRLKDSF